MNLPCKDCICFPICRSRYHAILNSDLSEIIPNVSTQYKVKHLNIIGYARYRVSEKCKPLARYLYSGREYFVMNTSKPIRIIIPHTALLKKFKRLYFDRYYNKGIK